MYMYRLVDKIPDKLMDTLVGSGVSMNRYSVEG
jgi:hypothetical protein